MPPARHSRHPEAAISQRRLTTDRLQRRKLKPGRGHRIDTPQRGEQLHRLHIPNHRHSQFDELALDFSFGQWRFRIATTVWREASVS